ncbi:MAG: 4Fe-4S dicluster domain-containing protein [Verrucomicrobia bacterium]|nr:4Fe-4S dicluster domain-containing protein [Verrucomicrobiota bacterium]
MPTPESFLDERQALACVHCGLCLGACPTYLETGNENDSPRGRIYLMRAMQSGRLPADGAAVRHVDLCLGCRACETACPSGVQYGALLEASRDHIERHHRRPLLQRVLRRFVIEKIFPHPRRMKRALLPAKLVKFFGASPLLPGFVRDALDLIPDDASESKLPAESPAVAQPARGKVGFISGCVMSVMFGGTNASSVRQLNRAGFDVVTPAEQGCCGALFAHGGNLAGARACARRNIAVFEPRGLDAIVINAAGCGSTLKEYGHLLHDDPAWRDRAAAFSAKVKDLTEVLPVADCRLPVVPKAGDGAASIRHSPVTYHDACHLAHPQRITRQPRDLVKAVAGAKFIELAESDVCCGSAGSYNLTEPEMAARLQRRKVEHILRTGARIVVTTNPGCLLQIRAGLARAGAGHVRVLHIADYLAEADSAADPAQPARELNV